MSPMHYELTTLPGGLRVITEPMPSLRSVAIGCWVDTGSRDELPHEAGASHFLEHLLFKGSERFSSRDISERFDAMGAESNAFTSKDHTCFWARLLDDDLAEGVELLAEMLQAPAFRQHEIDAERDVVIEEINESEDDPADVAFEAFTRAVFEGHPLAAPVLGSRASILSMQREDIAGYWARRYAAGSTVVAMAGSLDHDRAVKIVSEAFSDWTGTAGGHEHSPAALTPAVSITHRPTEQAHLVIGGRGFDRTDERRWPYEVMNLVLGGGMSSRLFATIREEHGLAYSVFSFRAAYADTGAWGVYTATTPSKADRVLGLIRSELRRIVDAGITDAELERAKGAMRGGLALAMEDANSRMVRLGRDELVGGDHLSVDERIAKIESVTRSDVAAVAADFLDAPRVISAVGPFEEGALEDHLA